MGPVNKFELNFLHSKAANRRNIPETTEHKNRK